MPTTLSYSTSPEWRRSTSPTSPKLRQRASKERLDSNRASSGDWRVAEQRKPGKPRTIPQRLEDRRKREYRLKELLSHTILPDEGERAKIYKSLKTNTNDFTTFLVEAVWGAHGGKHLPSDIYYKQYIEPGHCHYSMSPAIFVTLAETLASDANKQTQITHHHLQLLDQIIAERSKHSYWMFRLNSDVDADEQHQYFVDMMEDCREIFAHHLKLKAEKNTTKQKPAAAPPASVTITRGNSLGKRSRPNINLDELEKRKAIRVGILASKTPNLKPNLGMSWRTGGHKATTAKGSWAAIATIKA